MFCSVIRKCTENDREAKNHTMYAQWRGWANVLEGLKKLHPEIVCPRVHQFTPDFGSIYDTFPLE